MRRVINLFLVLLLMLGSLGFTESAENEPLTIESETIEVSSDLRGDNQSEVTESPDPTEETLMTSVGCTWSRYKPKGWVCLKIKGTSTWVDYFRVYRTADGNMGWQNRFICDWQTKLVIYYPSGAKTTHWGKYKSGCSWNLAYTDYVWQAYLPHGTKVCGSFYSGRRSLTGGLPDGTVCNKILR